MRFVFILFAIVAIISMGGSAHAESWRVEQLGSGEFTTIQDAVDAAADGDTILIGPGHYKDMHQVEQSGFTPEVVVSWEDARELTFIGVGPDQVILGPDEYNEFDLGPKGIYHPGSERVHVSGISFQNFYVALRISGGCEVDNCIFNFSYEGIAQIGAGICRVTNCEFHHQLFSYGIASWNATEFTVENCLFEKAKVYFDGISNVTVSDCSFDGMIGSFVGSDGSFINNVAAVNYNHSLYISSHSQVLIQDCEFSVLPDGGRILHVVDYGTNVEINDSIFSGGWFATMHFRVSPTVVARGNHFIKGPESDAFTVRIQDWSIPFNGSIDLRGNYWGTDNPSLVAQWIYDGVDDPEIHVEVQYLPIADGPLPTEKISLGGLKAMYRDGGK